MCMVISPEWRKPKKQSTDADLSITLSSNADRFDSTAKRSWSKRLGVTGSHFRAGSSGYLNSAERILWRIYFSLGMSWTKGSGCD